MDAHLAGNTYFTGADISLAGNTYFTGADISLADISFMPYVEYMVPTPASERIATTVRRRRGIRAASASA